ncbi:MAG TPA: hypothetical protein VFQ80_14365, partial [Thermomicrobiales bacterium]|nr:hypothetical protein [Thermomicrobiales bacterium]
ADWPMDRGDAARTGVAAMAGPLGAPVQRWRAQVQGGVHSAPAVVGGVVLDGRGNVYVADYDGGRIQKFQLLPPLNVLTAAAAETERGGNLEGEG